MNSSNANTTLAFRPSRGRLATLACLLEASAPKPGNVHRGADFEDLTFVDLATSAVAIGAAIDAVLEGKSTGHCGRRILSPTEPQTDSNRRKNSPPTVDDSPPIGFEATREGRMVLAAVDAMNAVCDRNAYLGTVLLLAPLCLVPEGEPLAVGVRRVLDRLNAADAMDVYEAIRRARPGGLGQADAYDVRRAAPDDLLVAMRAAADRDLVARQYTNGYAEVIGEIAPCIAAARDDGLSTTAAIIHAHLVTIARHGDSLIGRKCGVDVSAAASARAQHVLDAGEPNSEVYFSALADFDFWLRSDGHRRNPGTTADLIAAALFVLLRDGRLPPPWR